MNLALAEFADAVNPEGKKQILLVLDCAGFHTSDALEVSAGIELFYLPPYSPELQPAERLWPLLKEVIANRVMKTLCALEEVIVNRCRWFLNNCEIVQSHVGFEWICKTDNNKIPVNLVLEVPGCSAYRTLLDAIYSARGIETDEAGEKNVVMHYEKPLKNYGKNTEKNL